MAEGQIMIPAHWLDGSGAANLTAVGIILVVVAIGTIGFFAGRLGR